MTDRSLATECPICLEVTFDVVTGECPSGPVADLPCRHLVHVKCLEEQARILHGHGRGGDRGIGGRGGGDHGPQVVAEFQPQLHRQPSHAFNTRSNFDDDDDDPPPPGPSELVELVELVESSSWISARREEEDRGGGDHHARGENDEGGADGDGDGDGDGTNATDDDEDDSSSSVPGAVPGVDGDDDGGDGDEEEEEDEDEGGGGEDESSDEEESFPGLISLNDSDEDEFPGLVPRGGGGDDDGANMDNWDHQDGDGAGDGDSPLPPRRTTLTGMRLFVNRGGVRPVQVRVVAPAVADDDEEEEGSSSDGYSDMPELISDPSGSSSSSSEEDTEEEEDTAAGEDDRGSRSGSSGGYTDMPELISYPGSDDLDTTTDEDDDDLGPGPGVPVGLVVPSMMPRNEREVDGEGADDDGRNGGEDHDEDHVDDDDSPPGLIDRDEDDDDEDPMPELMPRHGSSGDEDDLDGVAPGVGVVRFGFSSPQDEDGHERAEEEDNEDDGSDGEDREEEDDDVPPGLTSQESSSDEDEEEDDDDDSSGGDEESSSLPAVVRARMSRFEEMIVMREEYMFHVRDLLRLGDGLGLDHEHHHHPFFEFTVGGGRTRSRYGGSLKPDETCCPTCRHPVRLGDVVSRDHVAHLPAFWVGRIEFALKVLGVGMMRRSGGRRRLRRRREGGVPLDRLVRFLRAADSTLPPAIRDEYLDFDRLVAAAAASERSMSGGGDDLDLTTPTPTPFETALFHHRGGVSYGIAETSDRTVGGRSKGIWALVPGRRGWPESRRPSSEGSPAPPPTPPPSFWLYEWDPVPPGSKCRSCGRVEGCRVASRRRGVPVPVPDPDPTARSTGAAASTTDDRALGDNGPPPALRGGEDDGRAHLGATTMTSSSFASMMCTTYVSLSACSGCLESRDVSYYCGVECQRRDRPRHGRECRRFQSLRAGGLRPDLR